MLGDQLVESIFDGTPKHFVMEDVGTDVARRQVAHLGAGPQLAQVRRSFARHVRVVAGRHDDDAGAVHGPRVVGDVRELVHDTSHKLHGLLASLRPFYPVHLFIPGKKETMSDEKRNQMTSEAYSLLRNEPVDKASSFGSLERTPRRFKERGRLARDRLGSLKWNVSSMASASLARLLVVGFVWASIA